MEYFADWWFIYLLIAAGLAFIPSNIAKRKGYSFGGFWCLSFFLSFLVGIIVAACIPDRNEYVRRDEYYAQQYKQPGGGNFDRYCVKCGAGIAAGDAFCRKCGAKVD